MNFVSILFVLIFVFFSFLSFSNNSSNSLIQKYIQSHQVEELKKILKDPNIQNSGGRSPLHLAVRYGHLDIVQYLVKEKKANINIQTRFKRTALHLAILHHQFEIAIWLIQNGADASLFDHKKQSILHYLAQQKESKDSSSLLKMLTQKQMLLNAKDSLLNTPLHLAAYSGNYQMLSVWIQKDKTSIDSLNIYQQTPLHQSILGAIQSQSEEVKKRPHLYKEINTLSAYQKSIQVLVKHSLNINQQDQSGKSALHYASEHGLLSITSDLLTKKPNIDLQTKEGWSALHLAAANRHKEIVKLLLQHNANVNLKDKQDATPLYFAVGSGSKEIVSLLLRSKAVVFFVDSKTGKPVFSKSVSDRLKGLIQKFNQSEK